MVKARGWIVAVLLVAAGCSSSPTPDARSTPTSTPTSTPQPSPSTSAPVRPDVTSAELRVSVVQIVTRAGTGDAWKAECTGTKVRVDGTAYVLTARHCFADQIDPHKLFPSLYSRTASPRQPGLYRALDLTSGLGVQVGIRTVGADGRVDVRSTASVARVVVRYFPDVALLTVVRAGTAATDFRKLPALDYRVAVQGGPRDVGTVAFGLPAAARDELVRERGTYLGRVHDPGDPARILDIVGIHPKAPEHDACNYGASGSVAIVAPDGHLTGPLGVRFNFVNKAGTNGDDDPRNDRIGRRQLQLQLRRSLRGYPTICGYGVMTTDVLDSLTARVVKRARPH